MDTSPWTSLGTDVEAALLSLPGDGLLDLLLPGPVVTASWLVSRALLELSGAPPGAAAALVQAGWTSRRAGRWTRICGARSPARGSFGASRELAAQQVVSAVVVLLHDVLQVDPGDVELWVPGVHPDGWADADLPRGQQGLW